MVLALASFNFASKNQGAFCLLSSMPPVTDRLMTALPELDQVLVRRCLENPDSETAQKAFRALVERYSGLVFHYVSRFITQSEVAEEVTQEVFVTLYKNLAKFDTTRPFRPWLLRLASNQALSELRKQKVRQGDKIVSIDALKEVGFEASESDQLSQGETVSVDALTILEQRFETQQVFQLLDTLDEKYRQVLLLRYAQDLSYEEIAQRLGQPLNTIRTWIKRGLDKLKQAAIEAGLKR